MSGAAFFSLTACVILCGVWLQCDALPARRRSDLDPVQFHRSSGNIPLKTSTTRVRRKVPASSYFLSFSRYGGGSAGNAYQSPPKPAEPEPVSVSGSAASQSDTYRPDGSFSYGYNTDNGISVSVKGYQKEVAGKQGQAMEGQYSYPGPDGTPILTRWYADETGFHAEGAHLPVSILRNGLSG